MAAMHGRPFLLGSLALVLAASGFGLLGPVARLAYETGIQPMAFVSWRAAFALVAIVLIVAVQARRGTLIVNPLRLARRDLAGLVLVAVAGLALNLGTFIAFDLTTIALVLLAFYTYPALVTVTAVLLGHERLDTTRTIALGLALGGMVLVVAGGLGAPGAAGAKPFNVVGVLLGLFAAVSQTVFITVSRGRFQAIPAVQAMGWVILLIPVACVPIALLLGNDLDVPLRSGLAFGYAALAGIAGAGIPSILFLYGVRAIGGMRAGILMLIEPLVGVTLAAILLHESLGPLQVLGGAAILTAALLLQREAPSLEPELVVVPAAERG
jgi:drug/metabolite transporter (DMT)-like permease